MTAVDPALRRRMAEAALAIARRHVRGGPGDRAYSRPFVDAAFSSNIFYWDTCFIAASWAKYHQDELPVANALDNFYAPFYENYAADSAAPGRPARPDFCGWTALAPLALAREWLADA